MLMHLPPRRSGVGGTGRAAGAERGSIRLARTFVSAPERVAWLGREAYCMLRPESRGSEHRRQALLTRAEPTLGGTWSYLPEGRAAAAPALPGEGRLRGAVGTGEGVAALLAEEGEGAGVTWRLLVLGGEAWSERALPWHEGAASEPAYGAQAPALDRCRLVRLGESIGLVVIGGRGGGITEVWERVRAAGQDGSRAGGGTWMLRMSAPVAVPGADDPALASYFGAEGQVVALGWRAGKLTVSMMRPGEMVRLAELEEVPSTVQVAALEGDGALAMVWPVETSVAGGAADLSAGVLRLRMAEVSTQTGRVLHNGPARTAGPVSAREIQIVSALLVAVTVLMGLFILRPEGAKKPVAGLAPGEEIGTMSLRCWASAIDLLIGAALASMVLGIGMEDVLTVIARLTLREGAELAIGAGVGAWLHCTAGEWLWGRSVGKGLVGLRVVGLKPRAPAATDGADDRRLTLLQAGVRNAMKWLLPLPLLLLVGPRGVHLGDRLAGTAVVMMMPSGEGKQGE